MKNYWIGFAFGIGSTWGGLLLAYWWTRKRGTRA